MQRGQLSEIIRRGCAEVLRAKPCQSFLFRKLFEDWGGAAFDVAVTGEPAPALADVDGSEISGSFVHIAEQAPVIASASVCWRVASSVMPRRLFKTPVAGSRQGSLSE
jgi:hypothetical protein